jgi:hypothetical protein
MAAEPTEDAISSFISFTSSTRDEAVGLLKVRRIANYSVCARGDVMLNLDDTGK